jgi:hypothetical protein
MQWPAEKAATLTPISSFLPSDFIAINGSRLTQGVVVAVAESKSLIWSLTKAGD